MSTPLEKWVEESARITNRTKSSGAMARTQKTIASRRADTRRHHHRTERQNYPHCYLHRSNPNDVARTENVTFICTRKKDDAGPTNNWMSPEDGQGQGPPALRRRDEGPHDVRGALHSRPGRIRRTAASGSRSRTAAYVVASMRIMSRMGKAALDRLGNSADFVPGLHSLGDSNPEPPLHHAFPRRKIDLERRLGLWRKRAARQEMLRAAHRQLDGAPRRLDGRAHADSRAWKIPPAKSRTWPPRFPAPAARRISP